jgi:flagellar motor switch protein FliM
VDIPVEALSELRPGDVIRFDERFDEPVLVAVSDQAQAWAVPGRVGDRIALRLVSPLVPMEA